MEGGFGDNEIQPSIMGSRRQLIEQLKGIGQADGHRGGRDRGEQAVIMTAAPSEANSRETEGEAGNADQKAIRITQIRNFFASWLKDTVGAGSERSRLMDGDNFEPITSGIQTRIIDRLAGRTSIGKQCIGRDFASIGRIEQDRA